MSRFFLLFATVFTLFWFLIPQVFYLLSWLSCRLASSHLPWRPYAWASLFLVVLWWSVYVYGHYWGRFAYEVKPWTYTNPSLPHSFEGYRIVHISDLHLDGWKGNEGHLEEVVNTINSLQPDLICFTGDLVSLNHRELDAVSSILKQLKAKDGVVSVLGNHDYDPYEPGISARERQTRVDTLVKRERTELGWKLLLNEYVMIHRGEDSLAIIGVENQSCGVHSVIRRGRLQEAIKGTEGAMQILLSHDPTHWRAEVVGKTKIALTLSGHTHAMQLRVLGFTPSKWIYPDCDGQYVSADSTQTLYVNIGLGGTLPMRIGANPEITLITLSKTKE